MKSFEGLLGVILVISGCGEQDPFNLAQNPVSFAHDGDANNVLGSMSSSCNEKFIAPLIRNESEATSYSPIIGFTSSVTSPVDGDTQSFKPTTKPRCIEIQNHFSGAPIKEGTKIVPNEFSLEIDFATTAEQERQMLLGKAVNLRAENTQFAFTDGSLNNSLTDLEIRCPGTASVTCQITEIGDYKKCESYNVSYTDQCTFRSKLLFFSFSDHKKAQLDAMGELHISAEGSAQLKFTNISWSGLY